jgi:hypothetical protein
MNKINSDNLMYAQGGSWVVENGLRHKEDEARIKQHIKNKKFDKIAELLMLNGIDKRDTLARSNYIVIDFPKAWGNDTRQYVSQYGTKLSDTRTFELVFKFGIINNSIASKYFSDSEKQLWFKELGNKWILILKDGLGIITTLLVFK